MTNDPTAWDPPAEPLPDLATDQPAAPPPAPPEDAVKFTRAAALWTSLIIGFLILIVLLIFIAQNTDPGTFHFLGWNWTLPLGVALLLAAVGGGLLAVMVGAARIVQLRLAARKNLKAARRTF
ncbi:lipopolysaccharide assembly LapA domain-containing protein [Mycolicibacterium sp. P9-22]|jgi:uncharacterized integral membrane protein|uniref:LapA family protein n=1 Tax=Mycolicibacterium sp. P9-22 TaxID=2024613 RepID=UPI0011EBB49F|nr:lipopolysaccharide assembly protein LapA domain-containing protein [Mycolicibacterium sp. P9-22]KAA0112502.1 DUF1049 domain-containing protein [Mycolicibacterium sp. P9-22]